MFGKSAEIAVIVWLLCGIAVNISEQTEQFEMECNILTTLDTLQTRLEDQEKEIASLKQRLQGDEDAVAFKDCGEIFANGTTTSGVYIISPDGRCPFSVYCDITDDGWTVIQRRIDGAVDFNRTWEEYVQGFGEVGGEYWLGLEKIHRLTKDGYEIYFDMEHYNGTTEYMHYKSFSVRDASSAFTMDVDTFGHDGTLADFFSYRSGNKFSTFDHEVRGTTCPETGWWYLYSGGNCESPRAHPNGVFGRQGDGGLGFPIVGNLYMYFRISTLKVKQRKHQMCS